MELVRQRTLDRIVGASLCRFLSLFPWKYRWVDPGFRPRKILVVILSEMGSLVLAKPMFERIREKYPRAEVYLMIFERNNGLLDVLELVPRSHVLTLDDRSLGSFFLDSLRVVLRLRRIRIDTVIDCELFSRISSLLSLMSGARVRVGFHPHAQEGLYRGGYINRPALYNPYVHISQQFISMMESLPLHGTPLVKKTLGNKKPHVAPIRLDAEEKKRFFDRLQSDFPELKNRELVLVYPGGGLLPIRSWPLSHYSRLVKDLLSNGYAVGVIGPEEDRSLGEKILLSAKDKRCLNLAGYTKSVKELLFLLQWASLLIANDGGPGHFASLTGVPSIVFYGPETPVLYGALGEKAHCFYTPLSCSPCLTAYNHRKSPCDGDNVCLRQILPETVLRKALEMMAGTRAVTECMNGRRKPDPERH